MRKQDYNLLADTIRDLLAEAALFDNPHTKSVTTSMLSRVAYQFATKASVKPDEFLKACGIE